MNDLNKEPTLREALDELRGAWREWIDLKALQLRLWWELRG